MSVARRACRASITSRASAPGAGSTSIARSSVAMSARRSLSRRVDAVAQLRERFADRAKRDVELRPARSGAAGERERTFVVQPRQAGAREPAADVVPQRQRALLPLASRGEPREHAAGPREQCDRRADDDLPRRKLIELPFTPQRALPVAS